MFTDEEAGGCNRDISVVAWKWLRYNKLSARWVSLEKFTAGKFVKTFLTHTEFQDFSKRPLVDSILRVLNQADNLTGYFSSIRSNIILTSTSKSPKWALSTKFSNDAAFSHACYMPHQFHPSWMMALFQVRIIKLLTV
jgi:hypothetical protein